MGNQTITFRAQQPERWTVRHVGSIVAMHLDGDHFGSEVVPVVGSRRRIVQPSMSMFRMSIFRPVGTCLRRIPWSGSTSTMRLSMTSSARAKHRHFQLSSLSAACLSGWIELQLRQMRIQAALAYQRGVGAGGHDASLVENDDAVGAAHGRQPVRHHQRGPAARQPGQR